MKYFLIAGEASGDLHAAHLMRALREADSGARFRFYGGDEMQRVGGDLLCHYKELAYMGFIPVVLHLPRILRGMRDCKRAIREWQPDCVILVDYPGFNLKIAKFVRAEGLCPVCYYISPKIWAWKEGRIRAIRRDVDALYSILPFEVDFFEGRHDYQIDYVGNPTLDEVAAYQAEHGQPRPDGRTIALLPGSRRQEVEDNLSRMLEAVGPLTDYRAVVAQAPSLPRTFYDEVIRRSGMDPERVSFVEGRTYELLSRATAALVTSGTATLETALFRVPQVVCYYMRPAWLASKLRPYFLKVPYISLVNLIASAPVVTELVGIEMNARRLRCELEAILPGGTAREPMLRGYELMAHALGRPGAPKEAARLMVERLKGER